MTNAASATSSDVFRNASRSEVVAFGARQAAIAANAR